LSSKGRNKIVNKKIMAVDDNHLLPLFLFSIRF